MKKKTSRIMDFTVPADYRVKIIKNEMRDKHLDLARGLNKLWNMRGTVIPVVISLLGTLPQRLSKEVRRVVNRMMSRDHSNYSFTMIG